MDIKYIASLIEENNRLLKEHNALLKDIKNYVENPERINEQVAANIVGNAIYDVLFNNPDQLK